VCRGVPEHCLSPSLFRRFRQHLPLKDDKKAAQINDFSQDGCLLACAPTKR